MADLNATPSGNRIRISFFGRRNAGKSTLVNAFTGQDIAIVSDTPGTTTDPVSKAMEILPLGPCLVTDTAGLDDEGELGEQRVAKSLKVLETTDIAVWVTADGADADVVFLEKCRARNIVPLIYRRGDSVEGLKARIAALKVEEDPGLLAGLVGAGEQVVCVCPIDESAPKGRLILPQVQVVRACLDAHAIATVCQVAELGGVLAGLAGDALVITDSQAFAAVRDAVEAARVAQPERKIRLTSFSILFARQKGDLAAYVEGLSALRNLRDGDTVLVAEGCTHHRQCNDIGTTKIPKAIQKLAGGKKLAFVFSSGGAFPFEAGAGNVKLVVQCGGCMLTRREVLRRIGLSCAAGVPIVNYGMVLAAANGIPVEDVI